MKQLKKLILIHCFILPILAGASEFKSTVQPFLQKYCLDCHDDETQKGDVALHDLTNVSPDNSALWKRVWEEIALKEMPPRKKKKQPGLQERYEVSHWITSNLEKALTAKGGFDGHQRPLKGNHLDHDLLFNTTHKNLEPASSPARIWRIHPKEHVVRLNELVSHEPAYDPAAPGKYVRGDSFVPLLNNQNKSKVFLGMDRYMGHGQQVREFAQSSEGFYPVFSSPRIHGLRDFPHMHSVNSSEVTDMLSVAEKILTFMAYGPQAVPSQFVENKKAMIMAKRQLKHNWDPTRIVFYGKEDKRPLTPVYELMKSPGISDSRLTETINFLFESVTLRKPTKAETATYLAIAKDSVKSLGKEKGLIPGLAPIFVNHNAFFRHELAETGRPDKYGRVMLQGQELVLAVNHAFSYIMPDDQLNKALSAGKLKTREDVKREVTRILNDDSIRKPRILQFFREYFDYGHAADISKCNTSPAKFRGRFTNGPFVGDSHVIGMVSQIANTDRLIELILQEDKNVFNELLTTDRVIYGDADDVYFKNVDKGWVPPASFFDGNITRGKNKIVVPHVKDKDGKPFKRIGFRKGNGEKEEEFQARKKAYTEARNEYFKDLFPGKKTKIEVRLAKLYYKNEYEYLGVGGDLEKNLSKVNTKQRMGILTQPSWLVSHSDAMDNHAIARGKWIRERLLGDAVPDVPIGVDAMLPEEPKETLRHRMRVTRESECWRCHKKMDPLGMPFQMFNHLGMYRETEKGKPVDASGEIMFSGDPKLDGPVTNAIDMIKKLAASERVEQVFIRHVFRYWMGRNETLNDAPILKAAHKAYKESGGSMKALLISLLTSDAFLYRKVARK